MPSKTIAISENKSEEATPGIHDVRHCFQKPLRDIGIQRLQRLPDARKSFGDLDDFRKQEEDKNHKPSQQRASSLPARRKKGGYCKGSRAWRAAARKLTAMSREAPIMLADHHWVEAVDERHRYGHNLKFYFAHWEKSGSTQDFFDWLDRGEGSTVDLEICPRKTLDQQKVKYLSSCERDQYEVAVGTDGRLRYKQSGVVVQPAWGKSSNRTRTKNNLIYVVGPNRALYVAIKTKGRFHHSSFFAGGAVVAAGTLEVDEDGTLTKISPSSGHYRPSPDQFRYMKEVFVNGLGVNFDNVVMSEHAEQ